MKLKLILLVLFSIISAFFLQTSLGLIAIYISEFMRPNEVSLLGMLAFLILPSPLSPGLLLLPLTSIIVFYLTRTFLIKKGFYESSNWLKNARKHLKNPIHISDYMSAHELTYDEVKALIDSGKVSAYGSAKKENIYIDET